MSVRYHLWSKCLGVNLLASAFLGVGCNNGKGETMKDLDTIHPLQQLFEADQGKVRLLILLSPT